MGEYIKRFVVGVSQALVISPGRAYVRPSKTDFESDITRLRGDVKAVGRDLKNKLKQYSYGESSYHR